MIIVPNHHVIVPRTNNESSFLPHEITTDKVKRRARVVRKYMDYEDTIILDFIPVSDLWIEVYLEEYRVINPHYLTKRTGAWPYEVFNVQGNKIFFNHPIKGNVKVVCDTITHTDAETSKTPGVAGLHIDFQNIQSYDIYEHKFIPTRYSNNYYKFENSQLKLRIGDALYAEPLVLCEPCYGYVRVSKNRKELVYVPRKNFKGYDVFTYTLITQHGQMGPPAGYTIKVVEDEEKYWYNYSGHFDGMHSYLVLPDVHRTHLAALAGKKLTIEFFFFTKSITVDANYRVGLFGQHSTAAIFGRYSIYLQGHSVTGTQQLVFRYGVFSTDSLGNSQHDIYRLTSRQRLKQQHWHFVSVGIDATDPASTVIILAIDGNIEVFTDQDFTAQHVDNNYPFYLGSIFGCESQHFNGYISNFRLTMDQVLYTTWDYKVPIRTLANITGANILTLTNNVSSIHSVQNWVSNVLIPKQGNVDIVNIGPFSPSILTVDNIECLSGQTLIFKIENDYICSGTFVPWTIKVNAAPRLIGNVSNYTGTLSVDFKYVDSIDNIIIPTASELIDLQGNFIVDEVDEVRVTITNNPAFQNKTSIKFSLDSYPYMYETVTVFADPGGVVLNLDTANISSYLGYVHDLVNYNHGYIGNLQVYSSAYDGIFTLDGVADYISGNNSFAVDRTGDMSCDLWFRIAEPITGNVRIFGKGNASHVTYGLNYNTGSNKLFFERKTATDIAYVEGKPSTPLVGSWINVCAVTQGTKHKLFFNGNLLAVNGNDNKVFSSNPDGYTIGKADYSGFHKGDFSVCKLYSRPLTDAEIAANFANVKTRYGL